MERYLVFVWSGTIAVLVYMLIAELAKNYLDTTGSVAPEPSVEEFDPTFSSEGYSYDYQNPNNIGHGIAYDD